MTIWRAAWDAKTRSARNNFLLKLCGIDTSGFYASLDQK